MCEPREYRDAERERGRYRQRPQSSSLCHTGRCEQWRGQPPSPLPAAADHGVATTESERNAQMTRASCRRGGGGLRSALPLLSSNRFGGARRNMRSRYRQRAGAWYQPPGDIMNDTRAAIIDGLNVFRALESWGAALYAAWAAREPDERLRAGHLI